MLLNWFLRVTTITCIVISGYAQNPLDEVPVLKELMGDINQKCLEDINIQEKIVTLQQCTIENVFGDYDFKKLATDHSGFIGKLCTNGGQEILTCFDNLLSAMMPCFNKRLQTLAQNLMAMIKPGFKYVCLNGGQEIIQIVTKVKQRDCFKPVIDGVLQRCGASADPYEQLRKAFSLKFDEKDCKKLYDENSCLVDVWKNHCEKDVGQYIEKVFQKMIQSGACKKFLNLPGNDGNEVGGTDASHGDNQNSGLAIQYSMYTTFISFFLSFSYL